MPRRVDPLSAGWLRLVVVTDPETVLDGSLPLKLMHHIMILAVKRAEAFLVPARVSSTASTTPSELKWVKASGDYFGTDMMFAVVSVG